jgi:phosphoribosylaminoimidazole-succinocarboxamide synthase
VTWAIDLPLLYSGKVRDIYDAGDDHLLMVTSDRISAFDVVMNEAVPDKGRVLTAMSAFWFDAMADVAPNHLVSTSIVDLPDGADDRDLTGRFMLCRRAEMLPIECVVRGYLAGSAFSEYERDGTVNGAEMPTGLVEAARLTEPIFTPATKATGGHHDVNISLDEAAELVGRPLADKARELSLELYRHGAERAAAQGLIIADTKFELGLIDGELVVADEILTPDSSRFWPADGHTPGRTPESFDKQPVRDFLDGLAWDKTPPPPTLPDQVVAASRSRYVEAYERITGRRFTDWPGVA